MTNQMPFKDASEVDEQYNLIINGEVDTFFTCFYNHVIEAFKMTIESGKPKIPKIDAIKEITFRDLFELMVSYLPEQRPTLSEVQMHPWFNIKPFATKEAFAEEARARMQKYIQNHLMSDS